VSDGRGGTAAAVTRVEIPPFSFFESRSGRGTPLVLIHGLGGSSDWWRRNVAELSKNHLVSAIDLIGFGRTRSFLRRSRLPLPFAEIAALLARWIESSFGEPVHLAGNSMGGHVAIHVAATRPDLVRSLTLIDSTGIPFELAPGEHLRNLAMPRGLASFALVLGRDLFRAGPSSVLLALGRLLVDDARPLLRQLRMPVQLIWGNRDPLVPLTYGKRMLSEVPHARLEVIDDAGHVPMWEQPAAFNRALLAFIDDVDHRATTIDAPPRFTWALSGWSDGIAHREAGHRRHVVLVHGLGVASTYFVRLARALFDRGVDAIAPDLPGFGESLDAPAMSPAETAEVLAKWAERMGIRDAIWIGHSAGCNAIVQLQRMRPDLVRRTVSVGPLWLRHPARLLGALLVDAFREPLALFPYVASAYWRCGAARWLMTFFRSLADIEAPPSAPTRLIAGARDPLPKRAALHDVITVPGAHACIFAAPEETAEAALA